jgi:hypothetical protein
VSSLEQTVRRKTKAAVLVAVLVQIGWIAGVALGIGVAASESESFIRVTPAWLIPSLMGVLALAITAVILAHLAIKISASARSTAMTSLVSELLTQENAIDHQKGLTNE